MQLCEIAIKTNPKDVLIEILTKYQDKRVMIMMSKKVYKEFTESNDVKFLLYCDYVDSCDKAYEVHENEQVEICQYYGTAVFELICGVYILKEFSSRLFKYMNPNDDEAELCIYITKK